MKDIISEIKRHANRVSEMAPEILSRLEALLGIIPEDALVLARYILEERYNSGLTLNEVCKLLKDLNWSESQIHEAIVRLFSMGYLKNHAFSLTKTEFSISIPPQIWNALKSDNKSFIDLYQSHLTEQYKDVLSIYAYAMLFFSGNISLAQWEEESQRFVEACDNQLIRQIRVLHANSFEVSVFVFIGIVSSMLKNKVEFNQLVTLFSLNPFDAARLLTEWQDELTGLQSTGLFLIEVDFEGTKIVTCTIPLSDFFKPELVTKDRVNFPPIPNVFERIKVSDITHKRLLYNADFQRQYDTLFQLLSPAVLSTYTAQMDAEGSPRGITILLSGLPGTGKTELARQLARATGRDLLLFSVSQQRSKWLGESEKNMKQVFDYYRKVSENPEHAPILFFNEADSVFNNRKHYGNGFSRTDNAIQTILLNEMERFQGIMICTTNIPEIMDSAYSRRFLYQLQIDLPDEPTRVELLRHYFDDLDDLSCRDFAAAYSFSAAQLTNFIRKRTIDRMIYPDVGPTATELVAFLEEERRSILPSTKQSARL